jgi:hypothetical protein
MELKRRWHGKQKITFNHDTAIRAAISCLDETAKQALHIRD